MTLYCTHRHTIDEHPACFAQGNIIDTREDQLKPWYQEEDYRIGYLDIESDGLRADFATMLTWCIKEKGGSTSFDVVRQEDLFSYKSDYNIVKSLIDELNRYKIIVTYYGSGYDLPYVRSKALHYGLEFPGFVLEEKKRGGSKYVPQLYHWDLWMVVKHKLLLSRNSLDAACDYLGIKGKTPIDKEMWRLAKYGHKEALSEVLSHNIADVEITEKLHDKLTPFWRWGRNAP